MLHGRYPASSLSGRRWRTQLPGCWPPSAAQTVHAVFPHTAFTKTRTTRYDAGSTEWCRLRICQVDQVHQSPRTMMYGFFTKGTDPPHRPYSSDFPALPSCLRLPPSPTHSRRRSLGHTAFTALEVLFGSPTTGRASLPTSLSLIGSLTPILPGTLPVLLRSRITLPYRAICKHLGAVGE